MTAPLQEGDRVGRFVIVRPLGEGGMGAVFEARDPELDRPVAIKLMHADADALRMLREGQALARVSHPNVVAVYELGVHADRVFLAMERIDGANLAQHLAAARPRWRDALGLMLQAGRGLAAVHDAGLIHRDFKPANVLVDRAGVVHVADFGLARSDHGDAAPARRADDAPASSASMLATTVAERGEAPTRPPVAGAPMLATPLTHDGAVMGTPRYMAPEQHAAGVVTPRADQFAFAVVAWEALYGEHPFGGDDRRELATRIAAGPRAAPAGRGAPRGLERVLVRALVADPQARWPTMHALIAALAAVPRRRRRIAGALVAVAAGAAVASAGALLAGGGDDDGVRCARAGDELALGWTDAARSAIRARFVAVAGAWADDSASRAIDRLDRWATGWRGARIDVCRATHELGAQSPALLDRRMACLDAQRLRFDALVAGFDRSTRAGLDRALAVIGALPAPEACAAVDLAAAAVATPRARSVAAAIAAAFAGIDLETPDRRDLADAAVVAARALGEPGPLAHALALQVRAQEGGAPVAARATLDEALQLAAASNDPAVEFEVAFQMVRRSVQDGDSDRIDALLPVARAAMVRAGSRPAAAARLAGLESMAMVQLGRVPQARAACDAAAAFGERLPDVATFCACVVPLMARDVDGAVAGCARARELARAEYGEVHPQILARGENYVIALNRAGRAKEALVIAQQNLDLAAKLDGADSESVATSLQNLSAIQHRLGDVAGSRDSLERALAIHARLGLPPRADRAGLLIELAYRLDQLGEKDAAIARADEAAAMAEQVMGDHPNLAIVLQKQALILTGRPSQHARGLTLLRRAIEIAERTQGPKSPLAGAVHANLAGVQLDAGDARAALAEADRAIAILDGGGGDPSHLVGVLRVRGEALVKLGRKREGAAALARADSLAGP